MSENRRNRRRKRADYVLPVKNGVTNKDKIWWIIAIIILVIILCFILFLRFLEIFVPIELLDEHVVKSSNIK